MSCPAVRAFWRAFWDTHPLSRILGHPRFAANGSEDFKGADFSPGTHTCEFHCSGGGKDSARKATTPTVAAWFDLDGDGIHNDGGNDDDGDDIHDYADSGGDAGFTADYELYTVTTSVPNPGGEETVDQENLVVKKAKGGSRAGPADFAMRESHDCASFSLYSLDASWLAHAGKETPLSRDAVIGDYNHDGYDDLAIEGLAGTAFPGMDRVVFARPNRSNYLPNRVAALDADARDFFGGLADWIASPGDFGNDFDVSVRVEEGAQIQGVAAAGSKPRLTISVKHFPGQPGFIGSNTT